MISDHLFQILANFNAKLPPSTVRDQNLRDLKDPATQVVITGQQVGLFGGPAFTLYKALSAIAGAKALEKENGTRIVPLFWLQTEDHDFEEIRRTYLCTRETEVVPLELPRSAGIESRSSVEFHTLGEEISELHTKLEEVVGFYPEASEILQLLRRSYLAGNSLSEAFAAFFAEIFVDEGLVFFNPCSSGVADLTRAVYQKALSESESISKILLTRQQELERAGVSSQVHIRKNSPLFFFHLDSPSGPRYRLEDRGEYWDLVGSEHSISKSELESLLQTAPDRFSSSALLRPLIQDYLFPTAAYVGGNAELSYHEQLKPLYSFFEIERPRIVPRSSFLCVESKANKWLDQLQLNTNDLKLSPEALASKLAAKNSDKETPDELVEKTLAAVIEALAPMRKTLENTDKTLLNSWQKTEEKISGLIKQITPRYTKALTTKDEVAVEQLRKLRQLLHPLEKEQERVYGAAFLLARFGIEFKQKVMSNLKVFDAETYRIDL